MNPLYSTRLHTRNPLFFQEFIRIQKKFKIFPPICRLSDALRLKIDVICRNKAVLHALIVVLQRQPDGVGVQVAVIAARHAVLLQKRQNFRAGVPAVARRIVQEAVFFRVPRQLQRAFEPPKLPPENFLVVAALLLRVVEPPARAAQGDIAVEEAGVVQDVEVCKPMLRAEAVKGQHAKLYINGKAYGTAKPDSVNVLEWKGIVLDTGENRIEVRNKYGADCCVWICPF